MRSQMIGWLLRSALLLSGALLLGHSPAVWAHGGVQGAETMPDTSTASGPAITIMRSASCGCCTKWGEHIAAAGFAITDVVTEEMDRVKQQHAIPDELASCHTAVVEGYVIEGHVPASSIQRLLKERPSIKGLTAPGMPMGSPGMDGPGITPEAFEVLAISADGGTSVFDHYSP